MKKLLPFLFLILAMSNAHAQTDIKKMQKLLVKINDELYIWPTEVSNQMYNTFLQELKNEGNVQQYALAQIDSSQWVIGKSYNMPFAEYYHKHPAYAQYPVVNISHAAAVLYCEWLSEKMNTLNNKKWKKVKVRLPNEAEWIRAAQAGDVNAIFAWTGADLKNKKGQYLANYKGENADTVKIAGSLSDAYTITAPVESYWPNKWGIYNMSGNVAEMISEPDILKGGSWMHTSQLLRIDNRLPYDGSPKAYAGFRFVVEILE